MVDIIIEKLGVIDILVNNAVSYSSGALSDLPEEEWDSTLDIGLKGYYLCVTEVVRNCMKARKRGCVVCMASTAGIRPVGHQGAYIIIKAGDIMMTKLFALELAEFGIRVNALAPGVVRTEGANGEMLRGFMTQIPLGRLTEMRELTAATIFLASDAASYISGHTLVVDGGRINNLPKRNTAANT